MFDNNLNKLKVEVKLYYKGIGCVFCPYFKEEVVFNRKGLNHIKFKSQREARSRADQYIRLKNIKFAPLIIQKSFTLQEVRIEKSLVKIKTNKKNERILRKVTYFGFVAIIHDRNYRKRFKIIVKQVEGRIKHFWSIIPFWKSNKEIKLHSGDLEKD